MLTKRTEFTAVSFMLTLSDAVEMIRAELDHDRKNWRTPKDTISWHFGHQYCKWLFDVRIPLNNTSYSVVLTFRSEWDAFAANWCSSPVSAPFIFGTKTQTGLFAAVLPRIDVTREAVDLSSFTPASAPILPTSTSAKIESSSSAAVARSRAGTATSTAATLNNNNPIVTSTAGSAPNAKPSSHNTAVQSHDQGSGLSTGAKAGIGVGVAIAVLLAVVIALIYLRRSRRRTRAYQSQRVGHLGNQRPYLDSKAELPGKEKPSKDGVGALELQDRDPQELPGNREAPPIPLASKPRSYSAFRGGDSHELA